MSGSSLVLNIQGSAAVPEIAPAGMGSVLALVTGTLGLLERRRKHGPVPAAKPVRRLAPPLRFHWRRASRRRRRGERRRPAL